MLFLSVRYNTNLTCEDPSLIPLNETSQFTSISTVFTSSLSYLSTRLRFLIKCSINRYFYNSFLQIVFVMCDIMLAIARTRFAGLVWDTHASLCLVVLSSSKVANNCSSSMFSMYVSCSMKHPFLWITAHSIARYCRGLDSNVFYIFVQYIANVTCC